MKYVTSHQTYEEVSLYKYLFFNILQDVVERDHIKAKYLCHRKKNYLKHTELF